MMSEILLSKEDTFTNRYQREVLQKTNEDILENFSLDTKTIDTGYKASYARHIFTKFGYTLEALEYVAASGSLNNALSQLFDTYFSKLDHNSLAKMLLQHEGPVSLSGRFDRLSDISDKEIIETLFKSGLTKHIQRQDVHVDRHAENNGTYDIAETDALFTDKGQRYITIIKDGKLDLYSKNVVNHKDLLPSDETALRAHTTGGWISIDKAKNIIRLFDASVDFSGKPHSAYRPLILLSLHEKYPDSIVVFD